MLYVTERAVFRLRDAGGLELVEVAPGVDPAAAGADPASLQGWQLVTIARRPTDPRDNLRLYKAIP